MTRNSCIIKRNDNKVNSLDDTLSGREGGILVLYSSHWVGFGMRNKCILQHVGENVCRKICLFNSVCLFDFVCFVYLFFLFACLFHCSKVQFLRITCLLALSTRYIVTA